MEPPKIPIHTQARDPLDPPSPDGLFGEHPLRGSNWKLTRAMVRGLATLRESWKLQTHLMAGGAAGAWGGEGAWGLPGPHFCPAFSPSCLLLKADSMRQWPFRGQVRTPKRMDQGSHRQLPLDGAPPRALGAVWDHTHSMTLPLPESAPARPARCQCTNAHSWDKPRTQGLDPQTSAYRGQALLCDQLLTVWPWPRFVTPP